MDILGYEFRLTFTSPLWIVHWKSKALQKRLSNQYTCITVIVSCFRRCYKSYSLRKRWNRKIHKLELFAEWIFALCTCGNLKTSHQSNCTYEWIIWRQYSETENCVTETRFSETEPCAAISYACRLFLWTIAFPNHTHVISLLLIFADSCRTTELYIFHLGYFQISISYIICKFQFLYIFVANYED